MIENDLEEPFHSWVPVSSSMGQAREGIHFGLIDTIFTALKVKSILKNDERSQG